MTNQNLGPRCLIECSLMPSGASAEERAEFMRKVAANCGSAVLACMDPTTGLYKPVCHQPEEVKRQMVAALRDNGQVGGEARVEQSDLQGIVTIRPTSGSLPRDRLSNGDKSPYFAH